MTIGQRIKKRRQELRLSQRDLAYRLGYSDHTTLTRIEAGRVDLPQTKIVLFAEALGVSPAYLMGWEDDHAPEEIGELAATMLQQPGALQMMQDYLSISEEDQATVRALVSSLAAKKKG